MFMLRDLAYRGGEGERRRRRRRGERGGRDMVFVCLCATLYMMSSH